MEDEQIKKVYKDNHFRGLAMKERESEGHSLRNRCGQGFCILLVEDINKFTCGTEKFDSISIGE